MDNFLNLVTTQGEAIFGSLWPLIWALVRIVIIVLPMFAAVAYMTLWERKLIGWMHIRLGPNRVGPLGLLQPIADALKLLMKEIISPTQASKVLYFIAPVALVRPARRVGGGPVEARLAVRILCFRTIVAALKVFELARATLETRAHPRKRVQSLVAYRTILARVLWIVGSSRAEGAR